MSITLQLGPADHGKAISFEEYLAGDYEPGYHYEIIEGRLYVTPLPRFAHDWVEQYVVDRLKAYARNPSAAIRHVSNKARVFVPGVSNVTAPEPDIAGYRDSLDSPYADWRDLSPLLVVEIVSGAEADKDFVRNVDLYGRVPSIAEYWIFDLRKDPSRPTLHVYRRQQDAWETELFPSTALYETPLLPEFALPVAPARGRESAESGE